MPQPRLLPPELNGASLLAMAEQNPGLFGGEMRTWQPSLRERIGNAVYDGASAIGLGGQANRMRGDVQTAADFVPGVGDAIGAQEGAQAYGKGDYLGAALAALGVVPVAGDAAAKGIRAYHGSPSREIEEFRTRNPRYGYLSPSFFAVDEGTPRARQYAEGYKPDDGSGALYEVDLRDKDILDARRPEDLAKIREALDANSRQGASHFLDDNKGFQRSGLPGWGDDSLYEALEAAGYKGVVLNERPDVRSIAVFDPSIIEIVRKYGIAGAVSAGLISQEVGEQMRAQGIGEGEV